MVSCLPPVSTVRRMPGVNQCSGRSLSTSIRTVPSRPRTPRTCATRRSRARSLADFEDVVLSRSV
jgi:hypothetical protein